MSEIQPLNNSEIQSNQLESRIKHQGSLKVIKKPPPPAQSFNRSNTISLPFNGQTANGHLTVNQPGKTKEIAPIVEDRRYNSLKHVPTRPWTENKTIPKSSSAQFSSKTHSSGSDDQDSVKTSNSKKIEELKKEKPKAEEVKDDNSLSDPSPPEVAISKKEEEEDQNQNGDSKVPSRPPPPNMKPPTRPSRPFPPPPQARMLENRLAKKRPPPMKPKVTVIDTRSEEQKSPPPDGDKCGNEKVEDIENEHTSSRDLNQLRVECSNFSNLPKRPPPPVNSPTKSTAPRKRVSFSDECEEEKTKNGDSTKESSNLEGVATKSTNNGVCPSPIEEEEMDELGALGGSNMSTKSPREGKKFVSKMKSSFRSFTQRRKNRTGDESGNSPSSRRTVSGGRIRSHNKSQQFDSERYPDKLPTGIISPLVVQCVAYLNHQECLDEPGLFRIPGDMSVMKKYRVDFARGEEVDLSECRDPHTIAGLLKLHFREQRQNIIPGTALVHKIALAVQDKDTEEFKSLVESVDVPSQAGIRMLAELLKKVTENSEVNHMTACTLATSCGPSFFPSLPPSSANAVLKFMTDNCDVIFGT